MGMVQILNYKSTSKKKILLTCQLGDNNSPFRYFWLATSSKKNIGHSIMIESSVIRAHHEDGITLDQEVHWPPFKYNHWYTLDTQCVDDYSSSKEMMDLQRGRFYVKLSLSNNIFRTKMSVPSSSASEKSSKQFLGLTEGQSVHQSVQYVDTEIWTSLRS